VTLETPLKKKGETDQMPEQQEKTSIKGYAGKILKVDLSTGTVEVEQPPETFYRRYLGGNGFIAYYLLKEVPQGADPLGPENRLIFAGGTLTAIPVAGSGRNAIGAKSPLTGGYGEADVGGFFGGELKRCGFDAIVVSGTAPEPVYLWIHDGQAEIRPAGHLWGTTTLECQEAIREELGEQRARLAMIGPGGEKLVRFACVINDLKHAAGRSGLGAVMGSKKLKAVAALGSGMVEVADPDRVKALGQWMRDHWREMSEGLYLYGTAEGVEGLNDSGALPTRNFQDGQFEAAEKISGPRMAETILEDRGGCYACPIHCKRVVAVEAYDVNPLYGGPEYETIGAFGSNCGVDDLGAISKCNELCNAYGVDTISAGMAVSFAMECFEKGLLATEDTGGLALRFGNAEAMVEITRRICEREGLGDLLAEGPARAAQEIGGGAEAYALHVKGQPLPMHEARTRHGQALGYAVSPTGADHMHNFWDGGLAKDPPGEGFQALGIYRSVPQTVLNTDKVRAYTFETTWRWLANHIGQCMFVNWSRDQVVDLIRAITGWQTNVWELMLVCQRGLTMARAFNLREGLTRADDVLPQRLMTEYHAAGQLNEKPIKPQTLDAAITGFYGLMGWDPQTGAPSASKLDELDISWVKAALP
jgi:aldehyde:ferredoxin oxidoreductase